MTQKYDRFKAAPWFVSGSRPSVLVGGAGGIGSWLTMLLNRAGFETYVYDFDLLEEINMAGQLFMHQSIGKPKVEALADVVHLLCKDRIIANCEKVDENTMTSDIVFSAFDNIKARRDMFTAWAMNFKGNPKAIFIDGRLTAEQLTIFSVKGDDENAINEYINDHLPDDSTIPELDCTFKQTSHGAAMIAAHMVEMFTNWYAGVLDKDKDRYTPFFWEYIIPIGFQHSRDANSTLRSNEDDPNLSFAEDILQEPKEEAKSEGIFDFFGNQQKVILPYPADLRDYYIIDGVPVHKDSPSIETLIATSNSVGTIERLTEQEVRERYGYVVGIDPQLRYVPRIDEATNPVEALEQAQNEIDRWVAETSRTPSESPTPDNSILEEETGNVDVPDNTEDTTHDGYDLP